MFSRQKSLIIGLLCVVSPWLTSGVMADVVYGPELVLNGGFDVDLTGWTAVSTYGATSIPDDGNLANGCVELENAQSVWKDFGVIPGANYLLSFYTKKMGVEADVNLSYRWSTQTDWIGDPIFFRVDTTSSWVKYSKEITAPTNAGIVRIFLAGGANRITRYDDVSLRQVIEAPIVE